MIQNMGMDIVVWSAANCPQCEKAKRLLKENKLLFEERKIGDKYTREDLWKLAPNVKSVPQVFINDRLVGGYDQLHDFLERTSYGNE